MRHRMRLSGASPTTSGGRVKRPTPREEIWDRYLRDCAPLVRVIVSDLQIRASQHDRREEDGDWHAEKELEIAADIEREYLKETP